MPSRHILPDAPIPNAPADSRSADGGPSRPRSRPAHRPVAAVLVTLLALGISGCATIMHGTTQQISVSSIPSSANVTVNGQVLGQTPVLADLKRKDTQMLRVTLDGYEPYELALVRNVSGWVWGNIVFGGLIGLAVDAISGGLYRLSPEQVEAELRSAGAADRLDSLGGENPELLYLTVVLNPDPDWERVGRVVREP